MRVVSIIDGVVTLTASTGELTELQLEGRIVVDEAPKPKAWTEPARDRTDVFCTWCSAKPGEDCRMPCGRVVTNCHVVRRAAFVLARDQLILGG